MEAAQCRAVLPSAIGHGGGRSELFKLDCSDDLWFLLIVVMTFSFLEFPLSCICCGRRILRCFKLQVFFGFLLA